MSIFQEVKQMLEKRQYAEIDAKVYRKVLDELYKIWLCVSHGEELPQDYIELRTWLYTRVAKDIIYQDGKYLNDHFCVGALYGMFRAYDDVISEFAAWRRIYKMVVDKVI